MPTLTTTFSPQPIPESGGASHRSRGLVLTLVAVALFALFLRGMYISGVAASHDTHSLAHFNGDSADYLHLGFNIAAEERYITGSFRSRIKALVRPPAYPLLIAAILETVGPDVDQGLDEAFWYSPDQPEWPEATPRDFENGRWLTPAMRPAVLTLYGLQALGDSILTVLSGALAWMVFRRTWVAAVAGIVMALNVTGIALTSAVLVDGVFALLATAALWATIRCAQALETSGELHRPLLIAATAGALWGCAQLTKPTLALWPVGLVVAWWILMGRRTLSRRSLACILLIAGGLVVSMGAWITRNALIEGVPTVSIVTERNLRLMIAPDVEAWAAIGSKPDRHARRKWYRKFGAEDRARESEPGMTPKRFVNDQREAAMAVLRAHPWLTFLTYLRNVESVIVSPWDVLDRQLPIPGYGLPLDDAPDPWTAGVRRVFEPFWIAEDARVVRWIWVGLALLAPLPCWLIWRNASPERRRRRLARAWVLLVWCAYLVAISGTTRDQGSRILYPAHPAAVVLALAWLTLPFHLLAASRSARDRAGSPND
jgi:hypothetical protein